MSVPRLATMRYLGGKNAGGPKQMAQWITSIIGAGPDLRYCEPFAGMLGVLLFRARSEVEVVNDLNRDVFRWWTVVRDRTEELAAKLAWTPAVSVQHLWSVNGDRPDGFDEELWGAYRLTVRALMTMGAKVDGGNHTALSLTHRPVSPPTPGGLLLLRDRMRYVQIECRDACEVIERIGRYSDALIYCDPPYPASSRTNAGYGAEMDEGDFVDAVLGARARVAVSGYPGSYPALDAAGWACHERESQSFLGPVAVGERNGPRTEVLWCNFEGGAQMRMDL